MQSTRKNECWPVLLHLSGGKKHIERAGGKEAFHGDPCQFRAQVVEIRLNLHDLVDLGVEGVRALAKERAEYIRTRATIASSESVADLLNLHLGKRTERRGKLGEQRGSGRCDKLVGLFDLLQRDSTQNLECRWRRHRQAAVRAIRPSGALSKRRSKHALNI